MQMSLGHRNPNYELITRLRALAHEPGPQADGRAMLEAASTIERAHEQGQREGIEMAAKVCAAFFVSDYAKDEDYAAINAGALFLTTALAGKIRALSHNPMAPIEEIS